jgi:Fic family protein
MQVRIVKLKSAELNFVDLVKVSSPVLQIQHQALPGWIGNSEYRKITGATRKTASRDLDDLVEKGVLQRAGEKRGTRYFLSRKK